MKNIFENVYFDKPFKTRDGRKAIYLGCKDSFHILSPQDYNGIIVYKDEDNGLVCEGEEQELDIVSEWQEEINEEELDKRAEKFCDKEYENPTDINKSQNGLELGYSNLLNCYKAGYREAKSEQILKNFY